MRKRKKNVFPFIIFFDTKVYVHKSQTEQQNNPQFCLVCFAAFYSVFRLFFGLQFDFESRVMAHHLTQPNVSVYGVHKC